MEETTVRGRWQDAWATRPARSRQDRMIAGVAAALGRRYAVDPVLVRVAFVVAAFSGPGIPLYLLGCAALPDENRTARGRAAAVLGSVLVVGAAVLLAVLLFGPEGGWVAPLLICLALLAALHVTRGNLGSAAAPVAPSEPVTVAVRTDENATVPTPSPPAWDPLGAAPFAWDLPEPGREPDPDAPSSRLTPLTLSLALLAAAAVGVVALAVPGGVSPAAIPATALAVVGAGLVVGAFRHAGRWLLPFAVVLGVATWLAASVPWAELDLDRGVGSIAETPRSTAAVAPEYTRGVGDVTLDLTGLDLRTAPGAPERGVRTAARVGVGSVTVVVPLDADVVVRGSSGLGDVTVDGQSRSGSAASLTVVDAGADGPGGGRIELDASTEVGSVTVTRG